MYVYCADLWCDYCGEKLCQEIPLPEGECEPYDTDTYPDGPLPEYEESDSIQYCAGCGELIPTVLTPEGVVEYTDEVMRTEKLEDRDLYRFMTQHLNGIRGISLPGFLEEHEDSIFEELTRRACTYKPVNKLRGRKYHYVIGYNRSEPQ